MRFLSRLLRGRGVAVLALAGVVALVACGVTGASSSSDADASATITEIMKRVERDYVVPVDRTKLVDKALNGMLSGLDPHSGYLDPVEYERLKSDMEGRFAGLGMQITEQNGLPQVLAPIDDTPAARAGIEPGDRIVRIDGQATTGMTLDDVVTRLRGNVGSSVRLTLERADRPPFDVALTRAIIQVRSVKSALQSNGVGYARISSFGDNTQQELVSAIAQLKKQAGGQLTGLVLDLREDPGGELKASVAVAGDFLDGGPVVATRSRDHKDDRVYMAQGASDLIKNVPMVVLIDGASASASEIVAGALQDYHRAVLMGTRSFGKGSVQSIIPVDGGGALRLTTALYYTPSGRSIQGTGLEPDVVVRVPKDQAVSNGLMLRESDFFGALQNPGGPGQPKTTEPAKPAASTGAADLDYPIKPALIATAQDAQLKAAVDYLHSHPGKTQ
jgi:carboxyl-terminal processing protease